MIENSANWLTMRSSIDGGSMNIRKSRFESRSNSSRLRTCSAMMSVVNTFADSSLSRARSFDGSSALTLW